METGIGLAHHEVFCTSIEGLGIPAGTDFKEYIRQQLDDCGHRSRAYFARTTTPVRSACVNWERVWMIAKNFFPILVPPVDFKDLHVEPCSAYSAESSKTQPRQAPSMIASQR